MNTQITSAIVQDIAECNQLSEAGMHHEVNLRIERLQKDIALQGLTRSDRGCRVLLLAAKNKFHLGDISGATECILQAQANKDLIAQSAELACDSAGIYGLILRREAQVLVKAGKPHMALAKNSESLDYFARVESMAMGDVLQLPKLNAMLNTCYTLGQKAMILGKSIDENAALIVEAVKIEHQIRRWTPSAIENNITGLAVNADLARPLGLTIDEVRLLDESDDYSAGCLALFGSPTNKHDWPTLILNTARKVYRKPAARAHGLILGGTILCSARYRHLLDSLKSSYQFALHDARLSLQKAIQRETNVTRKMRELSHKLDLLTGGQPFNDSKVFASGP